MGNFAAFVKIDVKPGTREAFKDLVLDNARCSVRDEPGCIQFDIMESDEDENAFYAFEVYEDEAALEAHRATEHSKRFKAAANKMMITNEMTRCWQIT
ncbi:MAG: putative quinol monooxygenase [Proteobacteria bacterium]|nr:putative quinol monooxygenase [Pseudomonadota bacterium]